MPYRTLLIVNPVSGMGRIKNYLLQIVEALGKGGNIVSVMVTEKHGDAMEFTAEYGDKFDRLICTGGDGTLSEVIGGLMRLPEDKRPVIGYIPLGTTNDIASTFRIPKLPLKALDLILKDDPHYIDIGKFEDQYFSYVTAFGAFTDISYTTPQNVKNTFGYLAYMLQALGSIPRLVSYHAVVEYDGGVLEDDFIFGAITNATSVAGFVKLNSRDVGLDDGLFEVILIKSPKNLADLSLCINNILNRDYNNEELYLLHSKSVKIHFNETVSWTRDGEHGGEYKDIFAENCYRAIRLLY